MRKKNKDAWQQLYDLISEYTREWRPRDDLHVIAHATDRCVEFILWDQKPPAGSLEMRRYRSTKRNVGTMRELAEAILDACDFVEESNPEWAGYE